MRLLTLFTLLSCLLSTARAEFMAPHAAPVDRLVRSAESFVADHLQDANAHYTLARVHYLAFAAKSDQVPSFGKDDGPVRVPDRAMAKYYFQPKPKDETVPKLDPSAVLAHAVAAQRSFQEASRLDPKNGLYQLGLASLLEEVRTWLSLAKPPSVPVDWQKLTIGQIRAAYAKAFDLALPNDAKATAIPLLGLEALPAYESAQALVRLATQDDASMTDADRQKLAEAKAAIEKFGKLRRGPITPIVFAMQPRQHLDELLADDVTVDFDLRGYGVAERWPWVKPELGFFVWDPQANSRIASARQLFGGYTFEIFRETGYDALAALDDNRDGQLAGAELAGIRVWFDRNSDGVATAGEVVSLDDLGITAIATSAPAKDGIHPMNPRGLTLRDGRTLPTWDWIVQPRCARPAGGSSLAFRR